MIINNINQAIKIAKRHMPDGKIQRIAEYRNLYLFIIYTPDPYEGEMDAFYSVDKNTGNFSDFAYLDEGVFEEVMDLLENTPTYKDVE